MIVPRLKPISQKRLAQIVKARNSEQYRNWRLSVLARDEYTCQYPSCNAKEKLEIHHIRKFAHNKHLRTAVYNGIVLCAKHHKMIQGNEGAYELMFFKLVKANAAKQKKKKEDESNKDNS